MNAPRQIFTPGESPADAEAQATVAETPTAPARKKPGPKPKGVLTEGDTPADDLAEFDSDELPPAPAAAFSPEQMALVQQMIASAVRASKSSQDPATAAKLAALANEAETLPTMDAAMAMCADAVARGQRPRAILTAQGWYVHPEMARTKDAGIAKLGG